MLFLTLEIKYILLALKKNNKTKQNKKSSARPVPMEIIKNSSRLPIKLGCSDGVLSVMGAANPVNSNYHLSHTSWIHRKQEKLKESESDCWISQTNWVWQLPLTSGGPEIGFLDLKSELVQETDSAGYGL